MLPSLSKSLGCAALAASLTFLGGCATGPAHHASSEATQAAFQALQSSDPEIQLARFGAYGRVAGRDFVGTMTDGGLAACSYRWELPGVVLEEHCSWPYNYLVAIQFNPVNRKLDVYNLHAGRKHIRELTVLPDGSVEWPELFFGLEPVSRVSYDEAAGIERVFQGSGDRMSLRPVSRAQMESVVAEARTQRAADERAKARRSREFWNSVSQGLGAASAQLKAENDAREMRAAEMRSAIMRSKDAEMRASSQRLAAQQREAEARARQERAAAARARQESAQSAGSGSSMGSIIVDDGEDYRKFQKAEAERKRRAAAEEAARTQRKAQLQAKSDAEAAARRAEFEKRRAKFEADERAHLANCAARGIPKERCPSRASRQ